MCNWKIHPESAEVTNTSVIPRLKFQDISHARLCPSSSVLIQVCAALHTLSPSGEKPHKPKYFGLKFHIYDLTQ